MLTQKEITDRKLKQGKDYLLIGGLPYRQGDKFLMSGKEVTVRKIIDPRHFFDERLNPWKANMFYEKHCAHCPELNQARKSEFEM